MTEDQNQISPTELQARVVVVEMQKLYDLHDVEGMDTKASQAIIVEFINCYLKLNGKQSRRSRLMKLFFAVESHLIQLLADQRKQRHDKVKRRAEQEVTK